jgi:Tfp pilus assembly protein FimT
VISLARRRGDDGLSLVELLITMTLLVVVVSLSGTMMVSILHTGSYTSAAAQDSSTLRVATGRLTKAIRESRQVITGSTAQSVTLWIDANRDNYKDPIELVTFALVQTSSGVSPALGELRQSTAASARYTVVARDLVAAAAFTYSPAAPSTTTVGVSLTARTTMGGKTPARRSVTTLVYLRG